MNPHLYLLLVSREVEEEAVDIIHTKIETVTPCFVAHHALHSDKNTGLVLNNQL